ncbi:hypothetical protein Cadr_000017894 [Camelus dromedarius]|uniref:Uncharacterized protein n=1 Tax=Camelus dromedarius TaxID=9838 RepID=A0A5N4D819_CAMDR|nr:hypothetical protein Cadr_000017894 [Camelus dromedarius]
MRGCGEQKCRPLRGHVSEGVWRDLGAFHMGGRTGAGTEEGESTCVTRPRCGGPREGQGPGDGFERSVSSPSDSGVYIAKLTSTFHSEAGDTDPRARPSPFSLAEPLLALCLPGGRFEFLVPGKLHLPCSTDSLVSQTWRKVAMAVWGAEGEGGRGSDPSRAWADHSWDLAQERGAGPWWSLRHEFRVTLVWMVRLASSVSGHPWWPLGCFLVPATTCSHTDGETFEASLPFKGGSGGKMASQQGRLKPGPESGCLWLGWVWWTGTTVNLSLEASVSLVATDLRMSPGHRGSPLEAGHTWTEGLAGSPPAPGSRGLVCERACVPTCHCGRLRVQVKRSFILVAEALGLGIRGSLAALAAERTLGHATTAAPGSHDSGMCCPESWAFLLSTSSPPPATIGLVSVGTEGEEKANQGQVGSSDSSGLFPAFQQLPDPEAPLGEPPGLDLGGGQLDVQVRKHCVNGVGREWSQASRGPAPKGPGWTLMTPLALSIWGLVGPSNPIAGVRAFPLAQCLGELCQATPRMGVVGGHSRHRSTVLGMLQLPGSDFTQTGRRERGGWQKSKVQDKNSDGLGDAESWGEGSWEVLWEELSSWRREWCEWRHKCGNRGCELGASDWPWNDGVCWERWGPEVEIPEAGKRVTEYLPGSRPVVLRAWRAGVENRGPRIRRLFSPGFGALAAEGRVLPLPHTGARGNILVLEEGTHCAVSSGSKTPGAEGWERTQSMVPSRETARESPCLWTCKSKGHLSPQCPALRSRTVRMEKGPLRPWVTVSGCHGELKEEALRLSHALLELGAGEVPLLQELGTGKEAVTGQDWALGKPEGQQDLAAEVVCRTMQEDMGRGGTKHRDQGESERRGSGAGSVDHSLECGPWAPWGGGGGDHNQPDSWLLRQQTPPGPTWLILTWTCSLATLRAASRGVGSPSDCLGTHDPQAVSHLFVTPKARQMGFEVGNRVAGLLACCRGGFWYSPGSWWFGQSDGMMTCISLVLKWNDQQRVALGPPLLRIQPSLRVGGNLADKHLRLGGRDVSPSFLPAPSLPSLSAPWQMIGRVWGTQDTLLSSVTHRTHLYLLPNSSRKSSHEAVVCGLWAVITGAQIADRGSVLMLIRDWVSPCCRNQGASAGEGFVSGCTTHELEDFWRSRLAYESGLSAAGTDSLTPKSGKTHITRRFRDALPPGTAGSRGPDGVGSVQTPQAPTGKEGNVTRKNETSKAHHEKSSLQIEGPWGDTLVGAGWSRLGGETLGLFVQGVLMGNGTGDGVVAEVGVDTAGTVWRLQEMVELWVLGLRCADEDVGSDGMGYSLGGINAMGERLAKGEKLAVVGVEDGAGPGAQEFKEMDSPQGFQKRTQPANTLISAHCRSGMSYVGILSIPFPFLLGSWQGCLFGGGFVVKPLAWVRTMPWCQEQQGCAWRRTAMEQVSPLGMAAWKKKDASKGRREALCPGLDLGHDMHGLPGWCWMVLDDAGAFPFLSFSFRGVCPQGQHPVTQGSLSASDFVQGSPGAPEVGPALSAPALCPWGLQKCQSQDENSHLLTPASVFFPTRLCLSQLLHPFEGFDVGVTGEVWGIADRGWTEASWSSWVGLALWWALGRCKSGMPLRSDPLRALEPTTCFTQRLTQGAALSLAVYSPVYSGNKLETAVLSLDACITPAISVGLTCGAGSSISLSSSPSTPAAELGLGPPPLGPLGRGRARERPEPVSSPAPGFPGSPGWRGMGEEVQEGGGAGKQNRELEGEGCGWAQIQPASLFPPPASPLPVLAGALEAGAWPGLLLGVTGVEATTPPPPAEACGMGFVTPKIQPCVYAGPPRAHQVPRADGAGSWGCGESGLASSPGQGAFSPSSAAARVQPQPEFSLSFLWAQTLVLNGVGVGGVGRTIRRKRSWAGDLWDFPGGWLGWEGGCGKLSKERTDVNEEKGGGGRQLEVPEVAPTVPQQRGSPEGSQAGQCTQLASVSPLPGVLGCPSEEQASQASVALGLRAWPQEGLGGARWSLVGVLCPADPSSLPPQVEPSEAQPHRQPEAEFHHPSLPPTAQLPAMPAMPASGPGDTSGSAPEREEDRKVSSRLYWGPSSRAWEGRGGQGPSPRNTALGSTGGRRMGLLVSMSKLRLGEVMLLTLVVLEQSFQPQVCAVVRGWPGRVPKTVFLSAQAGRLTQCSVCSGLPRHHHRHRHRGDGDFPPPPQAPSKCHFLAMEPVISGPVRDDLFTLLPNSSMGLNQLKEITADIGVPAGSQRFCLPAPLSLSRGVGYDAWWYLGVAGHAHGSHYVSLEPEWTPGTRGVSTLLTHHQGNKEAEPGYSAVGPDESLVSCIRAFPLLHLCGPDTCLLSPEFCRVPRDGGHWAGLLGVTGHPLGYSHLGLRQQPTQTLPPQSRGHLQPPIMPSPSWAWLCSFVRLGDPDPSPPLRVHALAVGGQLTRLPLVGAVKTAGLQSPQLLPWGAADRLSITAVQDIEKALDGESQCVTYWRCDFRPSRLAQHTHTQALSWTGAGAPPRPARWLTWHTSLAPLGWLPQLQGAALGGRAEALTATHCSLRKPGLGQGCCVAAEGKMGLGCGPRSLAEFPRAPGTKELGVAAQWPLHHRPHVPFPPPSRPRLVYLSLQGFLELPGLCLCCVLCLVCPFPDFLSSCLIKGLASVCLESQREPAWYLEGLDMPQPGPHPGLLNPAVLVLTGPHRDLRSTVWLTSSPVLPLEGRAPATAHRVGAQDVFCGLDRKEVESDKTSPQEDNPRTRIKPAGGGGHACSRDCRRLGMTIPSPCSLPHPTMHTSGALAGEGQLGKCGHRKGRGSRAGRSLGPDSEGIMELGCQASCGGGRGEREQEKGPGALEALGLVGRPQMPKCESAPGWAPDLKLPLPSGLRNNRCSEC